ncbi:MAG TPA: transketolase [Dissulfurispiraceae bacterium]|nr:transketolase [Dissulfurispiraceae bacterium]
MAGPSLIKHLHSLARLVRYFVLLSTTEARSGHPTSSLSAADLMTGLLFGGSFFFSPDEPRHPNNDRLIFSKGHAAPLLYALWAAAGAMTEEDLRTLRKFGSPLEGHPTPRFRYAEAATGSLGQGLSVGLGMALNGRYIDRLPYRTYVLLGDSEMTEGSVWEAIQLAAHYRLDNLIGILDVNRLGQRGETLHGHDVEAYRRRVSSFGWETEVIDGHSMDDIIPAFEKARKVRERPFMVIAKTIKGKGIPFFEDKEGWHGKALSPEEYRDALGELGGIDRDIRATVPSPPDLRPGPRERQEIAEPVYTAGKAVSTRRAYGMALVRICPGFPDMVVLDAEVGNSTYAGLFAKAFPERFFEMYVAEQNMVGAALGLSLRSKRPFVSTFAAFLTRAFDQIRMSRYSDAGIVFCGSHAGVSIGEDGSSQMGLEDIAMFRAIMDGIVLYPSDAISAERLVEEAARQEGIVYIRTTRQETPVLYGPDESFPIGGCKVLRKSDQDRLTVVAAGITVHEALAAYEELKRRDIDVRIIDLYSIKPIDTLALVRAAKETGCLVTVEDHVAEGGIGEAVRSALAVHPVPVHSLAVRKIPMSGRPDELLDYEDISRKAIVKTVVGLLNS